MTDLVGNNSTISPFNNIAIYSYGPWTMDHGPMQKICRPWTVACGLNHSLSGFRLEKYIQSMPNKLRCNSFSLTNTRKTSCLLGVLCSGATTSFQPFLGSAA